MRFWRHGGMRRGGGGVLAPTPALLPGGAPRPPPAAPPPAPGAPPLPTGTGVPLRHAAAAPGSAPAAHHCETDAAAPADQAGHAIPAPASDVTSDAGQPRSDTTDTHDTGGMACCAAAQCPATVAVPPSTLVA